MIADSDLTHCQRRIGAQSGAQHEENSFCLSSKTRGVNCLLGWNQKIWQTPSMDKQAQSALSPNKRALLRGSQVGLRLFGRHVTLWWSQQVRTENSIVTTHSDARLWRRFVRTPLH